MNNLFVRRALKESNALELYKSWKCQWIISKAFSYWRVEGKEIVLFCMVGNSSLSKSSRTAAMNMNKPWPALIVLHTHSRKRTLNIKQKLTVSKKVCTPLAELPNGWAAQAMNQPPPSQCHMREWECVCVHPKLRQLQCQIITFVLHQCLNLRPSTNVQNCWALFSILLQDSTSHTSTYLPL